MRTFRVTKEYTVQAEIDIEAIDLRSAEVAAEHIDLERARELERAGEAELSTQDELVLSGECL